MHNRENRVLKIIHFSPLGMVALGSLKMRVRALTNHLFDGGFS